MWAQWAWLFSCTSEDFGRQISDGCVFREKMQHFSFRLTDLCSFVLACFKPNIFFGVQEGFHWFLPGWIEKGASAYSLLMKIIIKRILLLLPTPHFSPSYIYTNILFLFRNIINRWRYFSVSFFFILQASEYNTIIVCLCVARSIVFLVEKPIKRLKFQNF